MTIPEMTKKLLNLVKRKNAHKRLDEKDRTKVSKKKKPEPILERSLLLELTEFDWLAI